MNVKSNSGFCFRLANDNDTDLVIFQNDSSGDIGCISQVGHQDRSQIIQLTEDECFTKSKIAMQIFSSIGNSLVSDVFTYLYMFRLLKEFIIHRLMMLQKT